jgi:hypothetical protein
MTPSDVRKMGLVTCRLCRKPLRVLTPSHLHFIHGWERTTAFERYRKRYPQDELFGRAACRVRTEGGWSRDRVVREIRLLRRAGVPLHSKGMISGHSALYMRALALFPSWGRALAAAGVDYDQVRLRRWWTRKDILRWIRARHRRGLELRPGRTKRDHAGVFNAACREFGGWYPAIRAAGIKTFPEKTQLTWDRHRIVTAIRALPPGLRQKEVESKDPRLSGAIRRHFGSFAAAFRAARYVPAPAMRTWKWPREKILAVIGARAKGGVRLTTRGFSDLGGMSTAATDMFGSWENALRAAGFRPPPILRRPWRMH